MARPFQDHFLPPKLAASAFGGVDLQNKWYAIREFFVLFKARLKERFQQIDIWMTTYPIDVL